MGDLRLVDVARRMKEAIRETNTVARIGGDEFAIILGELGGDQATAILQARKIAEKLCQSLSTSHDLEKAEDRLCNSNDSEKYKYSASIGLTLFMGGQLTQDQLISQADAAMYQAKKGGGNQIHFYEADISRQVIFKCSLFVGFYVYKI